ncbi:hypothetical protein ACFFIS_08710 [Virgibacillus soli]|uniref:Uncharacterized protein n=1 Tax=Paracerasibacillus soli TaxID=480284 RepID=A0ABU5CNR5_9BACI|nr:hypothetical protein [Virgibacillus soli]MDY0407986.1 hypothetical protein [Virgibacillus soli]
MSIWFLFNLLLLLLSIWKLLIRHPFSISYWPLLLGFISLLFFLFNWTRHAVFSTIRNTPVRQKKIKWANLSKKVMPIHRWTGTIALFFVIIHGVSIISRYGIPIQWSKFTVGLCAGILMISMVITGWLRLYWPTRTKRMLHLYIGMTLFIIIFLHILL